MDDEPIKLVKNSFLSPVISPKEGSARANIDTSGYQDFVLNSGGNKRGSSPS